MAASILIADDDAVQRRLVENMVQKCGYEAVVVDSGDAAIAMLTAPDGPAIDAVVLDLVMPGLDGMGVLAKIRDAGLSTPVIVQTAHGGIDNVISAMRAGAQDFVVKPVGMERLQVSLRNALNTSALKGELQRIRHSREGRLTFSDIVTRSDAMAGVMRVAQKAAASTIPVLIEGESGVGKELFARAIHGTGERKSKPFVAVNCGAIPDNLVESILFGHEKGAFTGATERHTGKFVEASGGTLFLDEVSELPLAAQVKLLRALQEGTVEAVGGRKPVRVDVRIVSATNRKLLDRVKSGHFREDLFYRLHVLPLTIPPLRARREDIPHLLRHILAAHPQRWDRQRQHVQAIEQVFAEMAAFDAVEQFSVGCRNDTHVDPHGLAPADRFHRAFLQRAKQFHLGGERQFRDFVKKQRAAGGFDELTRVPFGSTGKGALLVAEQDRLHQIVGDRAAIDGDERLRFLLAATVDGACE